MVRVFYHNLFNLNMHSEVVEKASQEELQEFKKKWYDRKKTTLIIDILGVLLIELIDAKKIKNVLKMDKKDR